MDSPRPVVIEKKRHSLLMRWRIDRAVARSMRDDAAQGRHFDVVRRSIHGTVPSGKGGPVLLAACNELYYWEFARTFLRSIEALGAPERFHLHLCEPSEKALADVEAMASSLANVDLTWTWDDGKTALQPAYPTIYYAAVRFLLAPMIIEATRSTVLCLDIDGIARRPISQALEVISKDEDIRLIKRPGEKSVRRVLASALAIRPTEAGMRFAGRLGRAIAAIFSMRPRYHVDQITIVRTVEAMEARGEITAVQMPLAFADHEFAEDSVIWTAKSWQRKNSEAFTRAKGAVNGAFKNS